MIQLASYGNSSFQLTAEQDLTLFDVVPKMKSADLPSRFISEAIRTALSYEGVADLIFLWAKETDDGEKNEIIADIQELIDDCRKTAIEKHVSIKMNDLDAVRNNIRDFKDALLRIVDSNGGITLLSQMTGIPQPSLSRFFNSNAMPRRQTLLKIAEALKLNAVEISTPWER